MNPIRIAKKAIYSTIKPLYRVCKHPVKVDNKTILFISYLGKGYLCNPKYIHLELLKDPYFKDFKFIWVVKDTSVKIEGAKVIKYNTIEYLYYLAKSKFWIANCKLPEYVQKKKNQVYIQTWHGTPLKRLAHDIKVKDDTTFYRSKMTRDEMTRSYDVDSIKYDYLISPNPFTTSKYETAFKVPTAKIREYGYPRNDFLVNLTEEEIIKLKEQLGLPLEKKIILFAPTWRDNSFNEKGYVFELECNFHKWKEVLGEEYIVLFKPHYLISNKFSNEYLEDFLHICKEDEDINPLYAVSDLLITDYSSVFFDFTIQDKPVLFYMSDLEEYRDELRGFYLDIYKDLPGDIIESEDELLRTIKNGSYKNDDKLSSFRNRFHTLEKGNAAKCIVEQIIKEISLKDEM